ncbi:MAG TPA: radical SAM protein [Acidobacteriaceae bacterium]
MIDVLLTHSYHLLYDTKQARKMQPYMPLGTLYAATALRTVGMSVALADTMLSSPEETFTAALIRFQPRIVAIYEDDFNFLSKMCLTRMREVAWTIAAAAKAAGARVVMHGSDATDSPELFLQHGADYVLRGECEHTLVELCSYLLRGEQPREMDGLVSREKPNSVTGKRLARNAHWPEIPAPAIDLIDFSEYRSAWTKAHGYFSANMVSSRGCPYQCNWCAKPISGDKFQLRPPAVVAEEMRRMKYEVKADHIWFGDDVFALNARWMSEFAAEVMRRKASLPFKIQSRADLMSETTVAALQAAGCAEVWMGVESGSQRILNAMDKSLKLPAVLTARHRLRDAGIRACFFLQLGYPGETWDDLQQTIRLVRETRPDDIGISFSYPLPGTVFYERVKADLGEKRNWVDSDDLCIMFHGAYTTEFYRAVREALHAEVNSWHKGTGERPSDSEVECLWDNVMALEPVCRNAEPTRTAFNGRSTHSSVVPVTQLVASGGLS